MKTIWNTVNQVKTKSAMKNKMFLGMSIMINIVIGGGLWLLSGRLFLPGVDWLLCFMGYPAIFVGFFGGLIYLYNHEFET